MDRLAKTHRMCARHPALQIDERNVQIVRDMERRDELPLVSEPARCGLKRHPRRKKLLDASRLLRVRADSGGDWVCRRSGRRRRRVWWCRFRSVLRSGSVTPLFRGDWCQRKGDERQCNRRDGSGAHSSPSDWARATPVPRNAFKRPSVSSNKNAGGTKSAAGGQKSSAVYGCAVEVRFRNCRSKNSPVAFVTVRHVRNSRKSWMSSGITSSSTATPFSIRRCLRSTV